MPLPIIANNWPFAIAIPLLVGFRHIAKKIMNARYLRQSEEGGGAFSTRQARAALQVVGRVTKEATIASLRAKSPRRAQSVSACKSSIAAGPKALGPARRRGPAIRREVSRA